MGSIDHFHHHLQLLEHAGPKTVAPAYRLHTAMPGAVPVETSAAPLDTSRPKLVLLRPTDDAAAADVDDGEGGHYERIGVLDRPEPVCVPEAGADLQAFRRDQARRRCTMLLRCLCGVAISTGIIGMWPGMHLAWVFTCLAGVAALGLVGLIAYARELEGEQRRRRSRLPRSGFRPCGGRVSGGVGRGRFRGPPGRSPLNDRAAAESWRSLRGLRNGAGARLSWMAPGV